MKAKDIKYVLFCGNRMFGPFWSSSSAFAWARKQFAFTTDYYVRVLEPPS